jgi:hypothetical protein
MLTIVWNPRAFHLIRVLGDGRKFNSAYYTAEILSPLSEGLSIEVDGNERKLIVQASNARPHMAKVSTQFCEKNRMKRGYILHIRLISRHRTSILSATSRDA